MPLIPDIRFLENFQTGKIIFISTTGSYSHSSI